jgi:hypothetical protein
MATIPDSVKAQLDADWTGAGGTEPKYYVEEDYRTEPQLGDDVVLILSGTLKTDTRPINDTYSDHYHTIDLIVSTITSEDRLKELSDEVVRILNATAIANINYQRIINRKRVTTKNQNLFVYQEIITVDLREFVASSAAAYGAGATGDFIVTGDIKSSTSYSHEEALMLGSANAAWVPLSLDLVNVVGKAEGTGFTIRNVDGTDITLQYTLNLPTTKGSLKLYVSGIQTGLFDADANDYITQMTVRGLVYNGQTALEDHTTNYTTPAKVEHTFTAVDCSSYDAILLGMQLFCTDAGQIDIMFTNLRCYYDT